MATSCLVLPVSNLNLHLGLSRIEDFGVFYGVFADVLLTQLLINYSEHSSEGEGGGN